MSERETRRTAGLYLNSSAAAAISQGARALVTFAAQLILRRFIPVEDWGLFQWALMVFLLLGAVRDLGLGHHVLRVTPRPYGNLLALEVAWGGVLLVFAWLAAPLGTYLYAGDHPETVGVLRLLALFLFLEGLATVPRVYLEGELRVGRAVWPEILRNVVFMALACGLAVGGFGVWSLAVAHTVATGLYAAQLWWRVGREIPLAWRPGQTRTLLRASMPLAVIWFLAILIHNIDPLVLGLRFPFQDVGHFTFAFFWATIASSQLLMPAITRAFFPALMRFGAGTPEMFRAYRLSTVFISAFEVPTALFLFTNAELVVELVGGGQWVDAPTYLRILCFAPLADPFSRLGGEMMKAMHWDRRWILAALLTALTFGVGGYLATGWMGPVGLAWVHLLPLGGVVIALSMRRISPRGFTRLVRQLGWVYLIPVPLFALAYVLAGDRPVLRLVATGAAGALAVAVHAYRFGPTFLAFFRPHRAAGEA